jgi:hypothetical protein
LTNHKTTKIKREDRTEFYRSKAKFVLELEPTRNALFMGGIIIDQLYRCKVPEPQIMNIEQKFIDELKKWESYSKFIKIAWEFGNIVQNATGARVYVDILDKRR